MMKKRKITWKLKQLPTPDEITDLVKDKIITQEEARELLIEVHDDKDEDVEALKQEIEFLRKVVEELSNRSRTTIIEKIREVEVPRYIKQPWYEQYKWYCNTAVGALTDISTNDCSTVYELSAQNVDGTTKINSVFSV